MYYEEISFLPHVPDRLIDDLTTIRARGNLFDPQYEHFYSCFLVSRELKIFLQNYFEHTINARYQVITAQLPIHVDAGGLISKYNYLLDTGGDAVETRWWDSVTNPKTVVYKHCAPLKHWHKLTTDIPHDITPVARPRISIEIHMPKNDYVTDIMPDE